MQAILSVEQAQHQLLSWLTPIATKESCALHVATWRVLAEPVISGVGIPVNHLSMMDGYAVNCQQTDVNQPLCVSQRIAAGEVPTASLATNSLARIFTGAMLPDGADTVVMQEDTQIDTDGRVRINTPPKVGQHVRIAHSEIHAGQQLLPAGMRLTPQAVALCASVGISELTVYRPLTIGLLVTGSELIEPGQPLTAGKTYNANLYLIESLLRSYGYEVSSLGVVPDDLIATRQRLIAAASFDAIITTGGVSVGEEDHVRQAVSELGQIDAWKVRMKPGKPFAFGRVLQTPYFGLPGNPVSAFATFHLFVLPALYRLQGLAEMQFETELVAADFTIQAGDRREYLRAKIMHQKDTRRLHIHPNQNSSVLASTVWAEGFAVINEGTQVNIGDMVPFIPFHRFRH
jgi:molybdopterin molybdotransferase